MCQFGSEVSLASLTTQLTSNPQVISAASLVRHRFVSQRLKLPQYFQRARAPLLPKAIILLPDTRSMSSQRPLLLLR